MAKASDNLFPYVHLVPAAAPSSPAAGSERVYLDSGNGNKLTRKNSSGATTVIEGGGGGGTFIGARVYNSANISCASGAAVALTFDSERYDTDTIHSTTTNTSRLTATTAGKYQIGGSLFFANNTTGARGLQIQLNGATAIAIVRIPTVGGTDVPALQISTVYDLAANDYVELVAYQTSGGALNVSASGNQSPEFWMYKVG